MATAEQKAFLNEREVADLLTVNPRTIQRWRVSGEGPPCVRAGLRRIIYDQSVVEE